MVTEVIDMPVNDDAQAVTADPPTKIRVPRVPRRRRQEVPEEPNEAPPYEEPDFAPPSAPDYDDPDEAPPGYDDTEPEFRGRAFAVIPGQAQQAGGDRPPAYKVPTDDLFVDSYGLGVDFIDAPDLAVIAHELIETTPDFARLSNCTFRFFWVRKAGKERGRPALGKGAAPRGLLRHLCGSDFIVQVAANHCRDAEMTRDSVRALIFHILCSCQLDDDDAPRIVGPDFWGYALEVQQFGPWRSMLRVAETAFTQTEGRQLGLQFD